MLMRIKKRLDYSEYGGAPLLGLDGVCVIGPAVERQGRRKRRQSRKGSRRG